MSEKNCLLLASNESFSNAAKDREQLTGLKVGKSTIHRQAIGYEIPATKTQKVVKYLFLDGGNIKQFKIISSEFKMGKVFESKGFSIWIHAI